MHSTSVCTQARLRRSTCFGQKLLLSLQLPTMARPRNIGGFSRRLANCAGGVGVGGRGRSDRQHAGGAPLRARPVKHIGSLCHCCCCSGSSECETEHVADLNVRLSPPLAPPAPPISARTAFRNASRACSPPSSPCALATPPRTRPRPRRVGSGKARHDLAAGAVGSLQVALTYACCRCTLQASCYCATRESQKYTNA